MRKSNILKNFVYLLIISFVLLIAFQLSLIFDRDILKYLLWLTLAWFVFLLIYGFIKKRELNGMNLVLYLAQITIIFILNFVIWRFQ